MKSKLFFLFCLLSCLLHAQNFQWASQSNFLYATAGTTIASDDSGNVYTAGVYTTTNSIDPAGLYVSKCDPSGNLLWFQKGTAPHYYCVKTLKLTLDNMNNPVIAGKLEYCGIIINGVSLNNAQGMFVAKFSTIGVFQWAFNDGGAGSPFLNSVCSDKQGNIYVAGKYSDTVVFSGHSLPSTSSRFFGYVVKYDSNGQYIWSNVIRTGGDVGSEGIEVKVDNFDHVYLAGTYLNTTYIGNTTLAPYGSYDIFISLLDGSGNFIWAKRAGGSSSYTSNGPYGEDDAYALDVDSLGNAYITGGFSSNATFGTHNIVSTGNSRDVFVAKYDSTGNCLWVNKTGSPSGPVDEWATAITVDRQGNSYVNATGFITKFDSLGNYSWTLNVNAANTGMALGPEPNSLYIGGAFYGSATFGGITLSSSTQNGFIAKLIDTVSAATSVHGLAEKNSLTIFPNPGTGEFNLVYSGEASSLFFIHVKNVMGQTVYSKSYPGFKGSLKESVDLGKQAKGIYFIEVVEGKKKTVRKVILE